MSVWTLLTVSWHQDNLVRKTDFPWRTFIIQRLEVSRRGHTDPGPGNWGKCQRNRHGGDCYERGGAILKLKTVTRTDNYHFRGEYSKHAGPWPEFPQFSGKLQDTIAVRDGRGKRPAHRIKEIGKIIFVSQDPGTRYCESKHKPDPGLGFHFQFLNSLSHQIEFLKTEDRFSSHNSISVLFSGSFWRRIMEVDQRNQFKFSWWDVMSSS